MADFVQKRDDAAMLQVRFSRITFQPTSSGQRSRLFHKVFRTRFLSRPFRITFSTKSQSVFDENGMLFLQEWKGPAIQAAPQAAYTDDIGDEELDLFQWEAVGHTLFCKIKTTFRDFPPTD
ncbi:MAG: hypothetical protein ACI4TW_05065 [Prevotella sp.]